MSTLNETLRSQLDELLLLYRHRGFLCDNADDQLTNFMSLSNAIHINNTIKLKDEEAMSAGTDLKGKLLKQFFASYLVDLAICDARKTGLIYGLFRLGLFLVRNALCSPSNILYLTKVIYGAFHF